MYCTLNACRAYLYSVTRACDLGHVNSKDCAGALLYCAERGTQVCLQAIQCLGEIIKEYFICPCTVVHVHVPKEKGRRTVYLLLLAGSKHFIFLPLKKDEIL